MVSAVLPRLAPFLARVPGKGKLPGAPDLFCCPLSSFAHTACTSLADPAGEATLGKGDLTATGESLYVKDYK